jgi:hypothetical protein
MSVNPSGSSADFRQCMPADGTFSLQECTQENRRLWHITTTQNPRIDPRVKIALDFHSARRDAQLCEPRRRRRRGETQKKKVGGGRAHASGFSKPVDDETSLSPRKVYGSTCAPSPRSPTANEINLQIIRPRQRRSAAVRVLHPRRRHGGQDRHCGGNYRAFGKMIAHHGVVVVMVDFRNSLQPSFSSGSFDIPGRAETIGLSGLRWDARARGAKLGVDVKFRCRSG